MITKISVTGTKGKTTVVNFLAWVLQESKRFDNVLHVNTTGHFLNGKRKSDLSFSTRNWGLVPSVAPGRYLYEFTTPKTLNLNNLAVLECSLGSSSLSGLGYALHDVGIFLNVFEDHLGSSNRLQSKDDILEAKRFIATRIKKNGFAVLNADDSFVMKAYESINTQEMGIQVILFGLNISNKLIQKYPCVGYVTVENGYVIYVNSTSGTTKKIVKVANVEWTFDGKYSPSIYNLLAIVAGIYGLTKGKFLSGITSILEKTRMPEDGGRLTQFNSRDGVIVLADYAHEKYSLREIARLGAELKKREGKVIGVVRLAYDRTDALIRDTASYIATDYDSFIVYDKIDGYWKKAKPIQSVQFTQENGKISKIFAEALSLNNSNVQRIIREDLAIAEAVKQAKSGDVVIVIVNDDIKRSIDFIKKSFKAKRV